MRSDPLPAAGETIGERLKRLRLERGLSQRELAAPGVSYAYISRIEAGTRQPSVKALRRLATKLGVSAGYLETGSDLDPHEARELRLADLELAVRLGELDDVEERLEEAIDEALAAGDRPSATRARVTLSSLAYERGDFERAVALLEATLEVEEFDPVEHFDIYGELGRAYAAAGRPQQAVSLFRRCIDALADEGGDPALETRYATLLSYALSDMGDLGQAEEVVQKALDRVKDSADPYMRVRLYWSMARLAHAEGRASVALMNVRRAIALLQATDDTIHLARAHILAANITLGKGEADAAARHLDSAEHLLGVPVTTADLFEVKTLRARIATCEGRAPDAVKLAREALALVGQGAAADEGLAWSALGDALTLNGEHSEADDAFGRAVALLEEQGRWRPAANACRAWAKMLRHMGREQEALDVLERATELSMRASPDRAHAEH
jgi:tetratricopeptide (TPR) repeat protein